MRVIRTKIAGQDSLSSANAIFKSEASDTFVANSKTMNAKEVRKYNVTNIKFNNKVGYFSDSDTEATKDNSSEMINLKKAMEDPEGFVRPPSRKIAKLQPSSSAQTTQIRNKFGILENCEQMDSTEATPQPNPINKRQWIPPIIINSKIGNYKMFSQEVTSILGHGNFRVFYRNTGSKIILQNMSDRNKIIEEFKTNHLDFHTFTPNEEKTKKIVLKGAPEMDLDEVKNNLKQQGTNIETIIKMKTKRNEESFSYLVTVKKEQSLQDLKKIRNIDQCGIKWEKYHKKNTYTQCYNCQRFGHAESNCHQKARCVKCPSFHHWKNCNLTKTATSKAYCHNCGGEHAASFKNCPILLEYLQKRNETALQKQNFIPNQLPASPPIQQRPQTKTEEPTIQHNTPGTSNTYKRSYRDVLENNFSDTNNSGNDEIGELMELLNIVKNIKSDLKSCKNQFEKMTVIIKYLDKF